MNRGLKEGLKWIRDILLACLLAWFIISFIGQRTIVDGNSMYPTLNNGDNLVVEKVSYRFHEIERFDIIVFRYHDSKKTFYVKRVIGLPGERVRIKDGSIYINGEQLSENYGAELMKSGGRAEDSEILLGEDEYFVLGDNRNDSKDSRDPSVGNVKKSSIMGRAFLRVTPFTEFGLLKD